jgi:serine/threonine-protein kinase
MDVQSGEILADKYRVERTLGVGGMGLVVQATHLELDQRFAIKLMLPQVLERPDLVQRFLREAKAAVKLKSEHVGRVTDVGRLPNGVPYMVMEYLEGQDLNDLVKRHGPLPIQDAVEHIVQACDAIAEAHALGIVHRDIKPANLFLTYRRDGTPCVKVLDFGISKLSTEDPNGDPGLTRTATVMGSAFYMSPEQMLSTRDVDGRTDIWALGVTLYKLLTGVLPFRGDSLHQVSAQVLRDLPSPCRALRAEIPMGLDVIVLRCLEKAPAARFANVGELAVALCQFAPPRSRPLAERIARMTQTAPPLEPTLQYEAPRPSSIDLQAQRASSPNFGGSTTTPVQVAPTQPPGQRAGAISVAGMLAGVSGALVVGGTVVFLVMRQGEAVPSGASAEALGSGLVAGTSAVEEAPKPMPREADSSRAADAPLPPTALASSGPSTAPTSPSAAPATSKPSAAPAQRARGGRTATPPPPGIDDDFGPRK